MKERKDERESKRGGRLTTGESGGTQGFTVGHREIPRTSADEPSREVVVLHKSKRVYILDKISSIDASEHNRREGDLGHEEKKV